MPAERLPMRHLRELLRLYHAGLPQHVIAKSLGLAHPMRALDALLPWKWRSPNSDQAIANAA